MDSFWQGFEKKAIFGWGKKKPKATPKPKRKRYSMTIKDSQGKHNIYHADLTGRWAKKHMPKQHKILNAPYEAHPKNPGAWDKAYKEVEGAAKKKYGKDLYVYD